MVLGQRFMPMTRFSMWPATAVAVWTLIGLKPLSWADGAATYADMVRARKEGKPNIILIVVDGLTSGDLGAGAQKASLTPRIDRLAAEGVRFNQAYVGAADPILSRAVLLTGFSSRRIRIEGDCPPGHLPASAVTVAEVLQAAGYRTGAVGLWNLGGPGSPGAPNQQGFDEWLGCQEAGHARDLHPEYVWRNERRLAVRENAGGKKGLAAADYFTRAALNFVRSYQRYPLFLYWAYPAPAPEDRGSLAPRFDAHLGQLLDLIRELNLEDATALFITGGRATAFPAVPPASGDTSPGDSLGNHGDLADQALRAPLIVHWKGRIPGGKVSSQVCGFLDFLPTAAELARTSPASGFEGLSLMPLLRGDTTTEIRRLLTWETRRPVLREAVRRGEWKALRSAPDQPIELYHLLDDPAETTNVALQYPNVVSELAQHFRKDRN